MFFEGKKIKLRKREEKKSESKETSRKEGHCGGEYLHTTKFCFEVSSAWPSDLRPARARVHVHVHIHALFLPRFDWAGGVSSLLLLPLSSERLEERKRSEKKGTEALAC